MAILMTWPDQRIWAFSSIDSMLVEPALYSTSWSVTLSCQSVPLCETVPAIWFAGGMWSMFHTHCLVWRWLQPRRPWVLLTVSYLSVGGLLLSVFQLFGWPCGLWMRFGCPVIHWLRLWRQSTWIFPHTSAGLPQRYCLAGGELCLGLLWLGLPFSQKLMDNPKNLDESAKWSTMVCR